MSNSTDDLDDLYDEDETPDQPQLPKALRDHVRKLERQLAEKEKALSQALARLSENTVRDVLKEKGVDEKRAPRLAKFMKADEVDISDSAKVSEWLEENAELFGIELYSEPPAEQQEMQQELQRQARTAANSTVPSAAEDAIVRIQSAQTLEELTAAAAAAGIKIV